MSPFSNTRAILRWVAFALWLVLTFSLTAHHELWRDEIDSWLLARDASWSQMFSVLPDAGHPPLWYILLKFSVIGGLDWGAMQGINLLAVWGAGGLLLFRSSLPLSVAITVLFSFLFSFEYPVIARNYGLGILGLFLYADATTRRPPNWRISNIIAQILMCCSSVHFLALGLTLFAVRIWGNFRSKTNNLTRFATEELPFLIPFAVSVLVLWPTGKGQFSTSLVDQFQARNFLDSIANSLLPFDAPTAVTFILAICCYLWFILGSSHPVRTGVMFLAGAGILEAIFCLKYYSGAPRHSGLLLVWLWAVLWMNGLNLKIDPNVAVSHWRWLAAPLVSWLLFAWNFPVTLSVWQLEYKMNFSDAIEAARFLSRENVMKREVVCWKPRNCSTILAYLPSSRRFWSPVLNRRITYDHWDRESNGIHSQEGLDINGVINDTIPFFIDWGRRGGPLLVTMQKLKNPGTSGLRLLAPAPTKAWRILDESFWIYGPADDGELVDHGAGHED